MFIGTPSPLRSQPPPSRAGSTGVTRVAVRSVLRTGRAGYVPDVSEHLTDPAPETPSSTTTTGPTGPAGPAGKSDDPLRGSRTGAVWSAVVGLSVLLVLLIIFIAQNTQRGEVNFLGWSGTAPVSVLLLIATAAGLALAVIAASLRILQLRRRVKRQR